MKCYVKWPGSSVYSGLYEVDEYSIDEYVNIILGGEYGDWIITVPPEWTIGINDGWIAWQGGECPVAPDTIVEVVLRDGEKLPKCKARLRSWDHGIGGVETDDRDIIAYRVVDDGWRDWTPGQGQPSETRGKRGYLDEKSVKVNFDLLRWDLFSYSHRYKITGDAEPKQVPLSVIMDRSLWWRGDNGYWYAVDIHDPGDDIEFYLTNGTWVSRDWFTGREYRNAEDFVDE